MFLPQEIITILNHFEPAFTRPTYQKAMVLVVGTILARGRRTVTAVLRQMGLQQDKNWAKYHHVLNRAKWSSLQVAHMLLNLLVRFFVTVDAPVEMVIDETLERRWGPKISKRGHWRDSRASSKGMNVSNSGLRWIVLALVVKIPWSQRVWALPCLSVLATTPKVSEALGHRHKTLAQWAGQIAQWLHRTLPHRRIKLIGDGSYSVIDLGLTCTKLAITLIAPLRLDARLFTPPPEPEDKQVGRPRVVGHRLPNLAHIAVDPATIWQTDCLDWYGGQQRDIDWVSGTALWYSTGTDPLPIRWVLVRDPAGQLSTKAHFSTDLEQSPLEIISDCIKRWSIEVTFEESRAHLGVETQRQWNDQAIARTTPALFGLFSLVTLFGQVLRPDGSIPIIQSAWYTKPEPTFVDVLALIRRTLWDNFNYQTSALNPDMVLIPKGDLQRLAFAACY
jgi:hypothetical protein